MLRSTDGITETKQGEKRPQQNRNRLRNHKIPMSVAPEYKTESAMILKAK